jgi:hypothetical protein
MRVSSPALAPPLSPLALFPSMLPLPLLWLRLLRLAGLVGVVGHGEGAFEPCALEFGQHLSHLHLGRQEARPYVLHTTHRRHREAEEAERGSVKTQDTAAGSQKQYAAAGSFETRLLWALSPHEKANTDREREGPPTRAKNCTMTSLSGNGPYTTRDHSVYCTHRAQRARRRQRHGTTNLHHSFSMCLDRSRRFIKTIDQASGRRKGN